MSVQFGRSQSLPRYSQNGGRGNQVAGRHGERYVLAFTNCSRRSYEVLATVMVFHFFAKDKACAASTAASDGRNVGGDIQFFAAPKCRQDRSHIEGLQGPAREAKIGYRDDMLETPMHLIESPFEGHADLESPWHSLVVEQVPVRFDAQTLEFTLSLPACHRLLEVLAHDRERLPLQLLRIVLMQSATGVRLEAELFTLYCRHGISAWPEGAGLSVSEYGDEGGRNSLRSLVLVPGKDALRFRQSQPNTCRYPYQIYYGDVPANVAALAELAHESLEDTVGFSSEGRFLCVYSACNFMEAELRVLSGLMLIYGSVPTKVLRLEAGWLSFYGYRPRKRLSSLELVKGVSQLPGAVLQGFMDLTDDRFDGAYLALQFFLAGKQTDVWLEARYMLLMTCVESMDRTRQLKEKTTAALLGVSEEGAALFNGMRNQLVHGKGGYQQAFAVLREERNRNFVLELELQDCLPTPDQLDFPQLWLRLCERIDAFWCAYLGVDSALIAKRCTWRHVSLMPAVSLSFLDQEIDALAREERASNSMQFEELRQKNQRLEDEAATLKLKLKRQGQEIGKLKEKLERSAESN